MERHLMSLLVFLPFFGALALVFFPVQQATRLKSFSGWVALGASVASSLCGVILVFSMQKDQAGLQAVEWVSWIYSFSISYSLGLDGLNALLVLLLSIIFPLLIGMEWARATGARGVHGLLLLLQGSLAGATCAQDFFLLFFFWSITALPFYFLVGIWGGVGREKAAFRFMVTSALGNALFFLVLLLVFYSSGSQTFSLQELAASKLSEKAISFQIVFLLALALALRVPIWPLQGWFSEFAEEAPPTTFVALSALLVPVGAGLFFRLVYQLFPDVVPKLVDASLVVGMINLVAGVLIAATQRNLRQIWAFLSIGELGIALIGFGSTNQAGIMGALFNLFALGLSFAGFGIFCGILETRTRGHVFVNQEGKPVFGGLAVQAPMLSIAAAFLVCALLGMPAFSGFIGHSLILIGSFPKHLIVVIFACLMLLVATYSVFSLYKSLFFGPPQAGRSDLKDLTLREKLCLSPVIGALLFFGSYPKPLLDLVRPSVQAVLSAMRLGAE